MNKAEDLALAHWNYVRDVLTTHGLDERLIDAVGFHYQTAFIHGYKHAKEDMDGMATD